MKIFRSYISEIKWLIKKRLFLFATLYILHSFLYFFPKKIKARIHFKFIGKVKSLIREGDLKILLRFNDIGNFKEIFEWDVYKKLKVSPRDVVIDLGAHIGLYTLKIGKKCKKVIAIEPHPENFEILLKNIKLNHFENVEAIKCCVSNKDGYAQLFGEGGSASLLSREHHSFIKTKTLNIKKLIHKNLPTCIKADIEGSEEVVFYSLKDDKLKHIRKIILEVHPNMINEHRLISHLKKYFKLKKFPSYVYGTYILYGARK